MNNHNNNDIEIEGIDTQGTNALEKASGQALSVYQPKMPASKYPLIAFRLTADMQKAIETVAKEDGVSKSAVIKSALEAYMMKRDSVRTTLRHAS